LITAGRAAELGARVLVVEKMDEAGKKILITGKERCNLSNACADRGVSYLLRGQRGFSTQWLPSLLSGRAAGLALTLRCSHTGRARRAHLSHLRERADVRDALLRYATDHGARIRYGSPCEHLLTEGAALRASKLRSGEALTANAVILATGGASWPGTGSTGDGYRMAVEAGHTLIPLRPALVPLTVMEKTRAKALQGVSLRNVRCTFLAQGKEGKEKVLRPPYPIRPRRDAPHPLRRLRPLILTLSLLAVDSLRAGRRCSLHRPQAGWTEEEVRARRSGNSRPRRSATCHSSCKDWLPAAWRMCWRSEQHRRRPPCSHHPFGGTERLVKLFKVSLDDRRIAALSRGMVTAGGSP
jgi:hypothetical protein